jgi:hypothetical protein
MKIRNKIFIFALCFCVFLVSEVFSDGCPADPSFNPASVIHFTSKPIQPRYFHNKSTAQIEAMRHVWFGHMMHNPGITIEENELRAGYEFSGLRYSGGRRYCVWAASVKIDFSFTKMDVYISSHYPRGSCPYKVILWHENQHVAIDQRTLEKYRLIMREALMSARDIPTKASPLQVASLRQGKAIVSQRVERIVNPIYESFKEEIRAENAKIDTPENYRRTQAMCPDWR